ncbi:NCS2 family permease [Propionibacteriaceae bacterium Y1685]
MVSKSPKAAARTADPQKSVSGLDRWFEITQRGSTIPREIRGGLVTFFTMAYILALNPIIIGTSGDSQGLLLSGQPAELNGAVNGAGVDQTLAMVTAATALVAGVMTILMGVIGRYPMGMAAGLGLNAVVAFTVAKQFPWPQAMALVLLEGILIFILVLTGFRTAVFRAVPASLRAAITAGIGLFICLVGLVDAGIIRPGNPLVTFGVKGSLTGWPIAVFVFGLLLLIILSARKVPGAMLISILAATVAAVIIESIVKVGPYAAEENETGWMLNDPQITDIVAVPDLGLIGRIDLFGAFSDPKLVMTAVMLVFALLLADFFDTMGTVVAVGDEGKLLDKKGNPPHLTPILLVDSAAAAAGGLGSVSSNTAYVESTAGVADGARTGLASVITGVGFLLAMFFAPLVKVVPSEAAAPVLVFVGFLMISQVTKINWDDITEAIPAFLCMALMPFAYSITVGIGVGFISHVVLQIAKGNVRKIHPLLWVVFVAFVIYFVQGPILEAFAAPAEG